MDELLEAADHGDVETLEMLLRTGVKDDRNRRWSRAPLAASVNASDADGLTVLMHAVINSNAETVKFLLSMGADVNAKDHNNWTALFHAAKRGDVDIVQILWDNGADVKSKNGKGITALMQAAFNGNHACVERLLKFGADPNVKMTETSYTALMGAAEIECEACVRLLLAKDGIDVNAKDNKGETALMKVKPGSVVADLLQSAANRK